jgi:hypothetical protein
MAAICGTILGIDLVSGAVITKEKLGSGRCARRLRNPRHHILFCSATEPR